MDPANVALCYFYRNPPSDSGVRPLPYQRIADIVLKKDGHHPTKEAVYLAVQSFHR